MKTTYKSFNENKNEKVTASEIFQKIQEDFSDMDICEFNITLHLI
jgi:hypothetical protein